MPDKVIGWLELNGGVLTAKEISFHFGTPIQQVYRSLQHTVNNGLLVRDHWPERQGRKGSLQYYTLPQNRK